MDRERKVDLNIWNMLNEKVRIVKFQKMVIGQFDDLE
jgi:hypothetical protein